MFHTSAIESTEKNTIKDEKKRMQYISFSYACVGRIKVVHYHSNEKQYSYLKKPMRCIRMSVE